jgi:heptosyltransferase-1
VKTSAIGDVIQTFPVLEYLRSRFPQAQIDWVAEKAVAALLRSNLQVSNVIEMDSKLWRKRPFSIETRRGFKSFLKKLRATQYDCLFDLQGNTKSAVATYCARSKVKVGFDWKNVREKTNLLATNLHLNVPLDLNIRLKYLSLVQNYFSDASEFAFQGVHLQISEQENQKLRHIVDEQILPNRMRLMICFGSKWSNKRLETSTLIAFLQHVAQDYDPSFVFIFGDEEEKQTAAHLASIFKQRSVALGNLSLPLWQNLMWEMDGVIAVDSAALHLCGTTGIRSFSVFGPSSASCYRPIGIQHTSVQGACPYGRHFSSRCPILRTCSTGACIKDLKAEDLFQAFQSWSQLYQTR